MTEKKKENLKAVRALKQYICNCNNYCNSGHSKESLPNELNYMATHSSATSRTSCMLLFTF